MGSVKRFIKTVASALGTVATPCKRQTSPAGTARTGDWAIPAGAARELAAGQKLRRQRPQAKERRPLAGHEPRPHGGGQFDVGSARAKLFFSSGPFRIVKANRRGEPADRHAQLAQPPSELSMPRGGEFVDLEQVRLARQLPHLHSVVAIAATLGEHARERPLGARQRRKCQRWHGEPHQGHEKSPRTSVRGLGIHRVNQTE